MDKIFCLISTMMCLALFGCVETKDVDTDKNGGDVVISEPSEKITYTQITAEKAKEIMDSAGEYIILDTREQHEYDEGHIPGAILIPHMEIQSKAEAVIPDKDALILVYCRSGRRSKIAAESLCELGYTNVKEFGGIIDWPYETEK